MTLIRHLINSLFRTHTVSDEDYNDIVVKTINELKRDYPDKWK